MYGEFICGYWGLKGGVRMLQQEIFLQILLWVTLRGEGV